MEPYKPKLLIFSWFSNWRFKQFSLGLNIASEPREFLIDDYDVLNKDVPYKSRKYREYYVILFLGFWQLSLGVTLKSK